MFFTDLPLELLPLVINHIIRPHHLAQVCLVNRDFYSYTIPQLYERPAVYAWHRGGKKRAIQLFWALANCPRLARYVRRLELRDFPKAMPREDAAELTRLCVSGLENCINISYCTWTRDGTLKDDILEALSRCSSMESLEINGRHIRNYDPIVLHKFDTLKKIGVIMPTAEVVHALIGCFERNFETLQELTIICKFTSVVTDSWLQSMAPTLTRLRKLHLAGCPKVSHRGMIDLLKVNNSGLTELALEGVSPSFDMKEFAKSSAGALRRLISITLTFPIEGGDLAWLSDVEMLLFDVLSLKLFHLYTSGTGAKKSQSLDSGFVRRFIERHKESLTRFAVLRLPMSSRALEYVTMEARNLEQLFVSIWGKDMNKLGPIIAQSKTLRTLHISFAYNSNRFSSMYNDEESADDEDDHDVAEPHNRIPLPSMTELEELASRYFGERLMQFGVQTRVWQVERIFTSEAEEPGRSVQRRVKLGQYESPDIPDVFLVVRRDHGWV